jgi:hypothetical protein
MMHSKHSANEPGQLHVSFDSIHQDHPLWHKRNSIAIAATATVTSATAATASAGATSTSGGAAAPASDAYSLP